MSIFINGFIFAVLLFSLVGILVFRGVNTSKLESNSGYMIQFKVWRGASYPIFLNWIIGIVLAFFDHFKINYRMILIDGDAYLPRPQAFLFTAMILSTIFLVLFLVYLLKAADLIDGYDQLLNLGYYMWLINIAFVLNPFRILNYEGRRYFLKTFLKVLTSFISQIGLNTNFFVLIMISYTQPFSDFIFTILSLVYTSGSVIAPKARLGTFVFTQYMLVMLGFHGIRLHLRLNTSNLFSRPLLTVYSVIATINSVISSYVYNTLLYDGLFIYWIISSVVATLVGLNTEYKGNWGLLSFS